MDTRYSAGIPDMSFAISAFSGATNNVNGAGVAFPPSVHGQEFSPDQDQRMPSDPYSQPKVTDYMWMNQMPASNVALSNNTQEPLLLSNQWSAQLSATEDSLCSYDDNLSCLDNLLPLSKYAHPSDEAISFHLMRESSMHSPTFAEDFPHRSEESNQVQPVLSNNASDIQPGYQATLMQEMTPGFWDKSDTSTATKAEVGDDDGDDQEAPEWPLSLTTGLSLTDHEVPQLPSSSNAQNSKLLLSKDPAIEEGDVTGSNSSLYWLSDGQNAEISHILKNTVSWTKALRRILRIAFDKTLSHSYCGKAISRTGNIPLEAKKLAIIRGTYVVELSDSEIFTIAMVEIVTFMILKTGFIEYINS